MKQPRQLGPLGLFVVTVLAVSLAVVPAGADERPDAGTITEYLTFACDPLGITTGADGNLWFTDFCGGYVGRMTPQGTLTKFLTPTSGGTRGITAGPDGNVWFTEYHAGKLGRITPGGVITEFAIPTPNSGPEGITVGPDGNLWFTEQRANKIGRLTPGGAFQEFVIPTPDSGPALITAGPDGNLWFTEYFADKIGRITPGGVITEFVLPPFTGPAGITAGPDGNLWFAEFGKPGDAVPVYGMQIGRITPLGVVTEFPILSPAGMPRHIAAGADGNLWYTAAGADIIGRITPLGVVTEWEVSSWTGGVAPGPDRQIWFTEPGYVGRITTGVPEPDTTPPDTTIASGPSGTVSSAGATFAFTSSESGSSFACSLDGSAFITCSSPKTYTGLAGGSHTFDVRATDASGNTDPTPASRTWAVDLTAPDTTITSGPSGTVASRTATFGFTTSESGSSFACRLDQEAFAACTSPASYSGLSDGAHTFEVRSTDAAGNPDPTPASRSWTVDATAPGAPTLLAPASGTSTTNAKPAFDWSDVSDPSGVGYQLQVDNSGGSFPSPEINQNGIAVSTFTPSASLAVGTHAWRVRATDGAGNAGAWSEVFTVTITVPPGAIAGTVTSQTTKKAIAGATVGCGSAGSATTAADGTYSIAGVAPGSYTCTASASGHASASKTATVKSNATTTVSFALRKA